MPTENDKIIRALYLKGIIVGKVATIELTEPVYAKTEEGESVKVAKPGERYEAVMRTDGWHVRVNDHIKRITHDVIIPLANGKVR